MPKTLQSYRYTNPQNHNQNGASNDVRPRNIRCSHTGPPEATRPGEAPAPYGGGTPLPAGRGSATQRLALPRNRPLLRRGAQNGRQAEKLRSCEMAADTTAVAGLGGGLPAT